MVIDDGIDVDGQVEPPAKHGGHLDDSIALFRCHIVSAPVKVAKVLQADGICILPKDTCRNPLHGSSCHDRSVRKCGEMLPYVRPTVGSDVVVFHGLLPLKMVSSVEVRVVGVPGVVLLNAEDGPSDPLLHQPSPKLGQGHLGKSVSAFHR